ncbi:MAG: hypothetical protein K9K39_04635, partial [Desulfohalobiaceae bacterium]|nr:hypothetical protein [Desulfohalobiaceae bacterium]
MNRRVFVWCMVFLAAVSLALAGCAQKEPSEVEPAQVQEQETEKIEKKEPGVETEERERNATEEEEVEEYGVDQEEKKEAQKEAEEEGLSSEARKTLKERIHFAFDSPVLSQKAQHALKSKAKILKKNPGLRLLIEGHCDER